MNEQEFNEQLIAIIGREIVRLLSLEDDEGNKYGDQSEIAKLNEIYRSIANKDHPAYAKFLLEDDLIDDLLDKVEYNDLYHCIFNEDSPSFLWAQKVKERQVIEEKIITEPRYKYTFNEYTVIASSLEAAINLVKDKFEPGSKVICYCNGNPVMVTI
jgi:hypothetical protein